MYDWQWTPAGIEPVDYQVKSSLCSNCCCNIATIILQITETEIDFCIQSVVLNRFIAPVLYHNTADYTQWCRHMLGIKWYHFIPNDEVRCQTNQPLLTEIIQGRYLTLFGHIARLDNNIDAKQILTSSPSVYWKRPLG